MLAWWCVFPLLLFAIVEAVLGWPLAKIRASAPGNAPAHVLGSAAAGFLIPLLVAWIVYRLARRSQLAATITFAVLVLLASLGVAGSAAKYLPRPSNRQAYASFGTFGFDIPSQWHQQAHEGDKTPATIVLNGSTASNVGGLLNVDLGKPVLPTAADTAEAMAGPGHSPTRFLLDGAEGFRAETSSTDMSKPRCIAVIYRDGQAYLIMAAGTNTQAVSDAFEHVLATWRWGGVAQTR